MRKKILNETIDDSRLKGAYVWINNYLDSLEEFVHKDTGNIYLREYGDEYFTVSIIKKYDKCWVDPLFWNKFSKEFSLQGNEVKLLMTIWVEDTYGLKGINAGPIYGNDILVLRIPTN